MSHPFNRILNSVLADPPGSQIGFVNWDTLYRATSIERYIGGRFPAMGGGENTALYLLDSAGRNNVWYNQEFGPSANFVNSWVSTASGAYGPTLVGQPSVPGRLGFSFNGTDGYMYSADTFESTANSTLSTWMNPDTGWLAISCIIDPQTFTNDATVYNNSGLWNSYPGAYVGMHFKSDGNLYGYVYDSGAKVASMPFTTGRPCVIEWLHTGGNVWVAVNGVDSAKVSCGNVGALTDYELLGTGYAAATYIKCKIFETMAMVDVPSNRRLIVQDMLSWIT